jgi:CRP-like cAMP-binding protein
VRLWAGPIDTAPDFAFGGHIMLSQLSKTRLFSGIADENLKEISAFSEWVTYPTGAQPIIEGDERQHIDLLLLVEGEVDVEARFSPLPTAMKFNLHAIANEMFGEVAWLLGCRPTASVKCRKNCKFIRIDGSKLFDYCQAHPVVGIELMTRTAAVLAQRVVHLTELMRNKELFS